MATKTAPKLQITEIEATDERGLYQITGPRFTGKLAARVDVQAPRYSDQDEEIDVTVTVPQGEVLTINGIEISGYTRVRANGRNAFQWSAGGHLHRASWASGDISDAARSAISDAAVLVAKAFYSADRLFASRVRDAERVVQNAEEEVREAENKAHAARRALDAIIATGAAN